MQTNARLKRQFNSKFFLITVALLVIVLLCGTVFPVFGDTSSAKQTRIVRVGWWEQRGYMDISRDKDGNITRSGYMYEYLQAISQEVGWQYEFVDGSFSDLVAQTICEEPTIDIICCVFGGDGMPRGLTLPDLSTGSDFVTLYTNNDSDLNYNDIGQFDNLKIGCVSDGNISRYKEYATKNGIVFSESDFVKCSSNNEVREKLKNGYLDAAIEGGFQSNDDFRKLADFTPSPFYIAVKDKGTEPNLLLEELNKAMSLILLNNPYYNENLAKKYLTSRQQKFTLTTEEQQFVKGGVTIKVGFCNNWKPMQYVKTEGDVKIFEGVDKDILDRISELTGIRFEFIESDIVGDFNDKRVDAVLCDQEYKNIAKNDFVNTNSYFAMGLSLIRENRKPIDNTTAIPSYVYSYDTYVTSGNYEFIKCNSTEECLNLVLNGKTSQALVVTIVAQNYLNDYRYKSLSRTAMSGISYDCCIALRKNINPLVRTIINKGINFISQAEINDFVVKNTFLEQEITFERILSKLPPDVIMIFLIFLLMAIGMLVFFLIDRDKANKRINKLLFYDDVTGLLSTAGIEKLIEKELKKGKNLVLIDMKMEDFDRYLQLYGMEFSNDILRDAAKTFTSKSIHYGCAMSRLHKGHFLCVNSEGMTPEEIIKELTPIARRMEIRGVTVLFNYGIYTVTDNKISVQDMMKYAEEARRVTDKESQKFINIYDDSINTRNKVNNELIMAFDDGIANKEFIVYFQPKYDTNTEEMVGAEALVRWKRSNGIIMNPGQFIDLFEGNSRIVELDNYVLNVTCAYQREMRESGKKIVPVSVNFSRLHLFDENFPIFLKETVESYGLAHSDIEVEITETAAMRDTVIILPVIKQMREYGFKMEVDDFGSGYSSLNTIKDLPIDVIKIDRKFLISEANNTKVLAIINTIVKLSKELCITTVLEGVETAEQLEIARKCKVDIIQGYYYARPMDYSSYQELLVA